jgi:hypothetical protein
MVEYIYKLLAYINFGISVIKLLLAGTKVAPEHWGHATLVHTATKPLLLLAASVASTALALAAARPGHVFWWRADYAFAGLEGLLELLDLLV